MTSTPPLPPTSDIVTFEFDSSGLVSVRVADDWPRRTTPEEFPAAAMMAYAVQKQRVPTDVPADPDTWIDIPEGDVQAQLEGDLIKLGNEASELLKEAMALASAAPAAEPPAPQRYSDHRRHVSIDTYNGVIGTAEISPQWLKTADPSELEAALLEALQAAEAGSTDSPRGRVASRLASVQQRQRQIAAVLHDFERKN